MDHREDMTTRGKELDRGGSRIPPQHGSGLRHLPAEKRKQGYEDSRATSTFVGVKNERITPGRGAMSLCSARSVWVPVTSVDRLLRLLGCAVSEGEFRMARRFGLLTPFALVIPFFLSRSSRSRFWRSRSVGCPRCRCIALVRDAIGSLPALTLFLSRLFLLTLTLLNVRAFGGPAQIGQHSV